MVKFWVRMMVRRLRQEDCLKCQVFICCVVRSAAWSGLWRAFPLLKGVLPNCTFTSCSLWPKSVCLSLSVCLLLSTGLRAPGSLPLLLHSPQNSQSIMGPLTCLSSQGFKDNLHAVFCLAENAVGPNATRPDDIHLLYSGK